ncbi:MAG TPA: site-specific DNA-methyltransferase [Methanosarcina sp.]|nr:site-specific DNA-methyltransferase [Methanosarcina sp.]
MIDLTEPERLDLKSLSIVEDQKSKLKEIFPHIFNEDKIDFDKLRQTLGEEVNEGQELYGMTWPGKSECFKIIQLPSTGTLKPCREESVNFDETENLFIEGDNLEALKILQKSYYGKIKMIYIDPPYNTGKEFIYPDKYSETLDTYLAYTEQANDDGIKFSTNTEADGRFHSKWLNMMYPRLFLARNLLKEDGIIFISIDDHEADNLRKIGDEIFGEENLLGVFQWRRRQRADNRNQSNVSTDHEYIICYAKTDLSKFLGSEIDISKYHNPDNDPRGPWASIDLSGLATAAQRPNLHYNIVDPETGNVYPPNPSRGWSKSKENVDQMIKEGRILFPKSPSGRPREKKFLKDLNSNFTGFSTCLDSSQVGYTTDGTREVTLLLEGKYFDFPKPTSLISILLKQTTVDNDIILDFFSGSSTTANAVLNLNREDNNSRKFIMIQLPEPCDEASEAFKAGYKTIADIGKQRIRRAIKKIEDEGKQSSSQTTLFDTDSKDNIKKLDFGFKVFKLDKSNFNRWDGSIEVDTTGEKIIKQLQLAIENINPKSSEEDILYELLLKSGFSLTTKIEEIELADKKVYSIENGALLICISRELSKEVITEMAKKEPARVICLDDGFVGNDQLKTNAVQIMKSFGIEDFRTI